jgi:hypothetical protein
MTYDELLARITKLSITPETNVVPSELATALMAVVELHKPYPSKPHKPDGVLLCRECTDYSTANWPCSTIKAIEEAVQL